MLQVLGIRAVSGISSPEDCGMLLEAPNLYESASQVQGSYNQSGCCSGL